MLTFQLFLHHSIQIAFLRLLLSYLYSYPYPSLYLCPCSSLYPFPWPYLCPCPYLCPFPCSYPCLYYKNFNLTPSKSPNNHNKTFKSIAYFTLTFLSFWCQSSPPRHSSLFHPSSISSLSCPSCLSFCLSYHYPFPYL